MSKNNMKVSHNLIADFSGNNQYQHLYAVQGDSNTRMLVVSLKDNGRDWSAPVGVSAAVAFKKPDGTRGLYDTLPDGKPAVTIVGDKVTAILAPQVLTVPGDVMVSIVLFDKDMNRLSTFSFRVQVAEDPSAGQDVSNDYFNYTLSDAIQAAVSKMAAAGELQELIKGDKGDKGDTGAAGANGKSAYQYARDGGYTGTEEEFAQKLAKGYSGVTVADYGAKGDGATDDTTAFQTALAGNRVVLVPGGTYKLNGELVIGDNCCLELSQDTVLRFTQTTGNCIVLGMSSTLKGNHATVKVPYEFAGHVLHAYSNDSTSADIQAMPPWSRWDPQWKSGRYVTDLNICKADSRGFHYAVNPDECKGTAVYVSADNTDGYLTFMWGVHYSGLRIAGAFAYGIRAANFDNGWLHEMRIDAFIDACEIGVSLEDCQNTYISAIIQPRRAYTTDGVYKAYAKHGIQLIRSKNTDLSSSRIWDWNSTNSLYTENGEYQHISMIGDCSGTILNDYMYHGYGDTRKRIYTDTPSNLAQLTILQEPITRWFKTAEGVPYYFDGNTDKKLATQDELDTHFDTDMVKGFTDVLATATDTDGTVYNGIGYKAGPRLDTDGVLIAGADNTYTVTGFMPCSVGQKVYVEGMSLDSVDDWCRVCLYDADKNFIRFVALTGVTASSWYVKGEKTESGFWFSPQSVVGNENAAFVRFNVYTRMVGEYPMVAVDEEIKYTVEGFLADSIKVKGQNAILYSPSGKAYGLAVDDNGNVVANEIV